MIFVRKYFVSVLFLVLIIFLTPSVLGMFIQPDQKIPEIYNPQDLNRYTYVRNNPYKYIDPTGEAAVLFPGFGNTQTDQAAIQANFYSGDKFTQSSLPSTIGNYRDTQASVKYIQTQLSENPDQPVVLIGHSQGALATIKTAKQLIKEGVEAEKIHIITIDPAGLGGPGSAKIPEGVEATNYYTTSILSPFYAGRGKIKGAENIKITDTTHTTIDKNPEVVESIVSRTQQLHSNQKKINQQRNRNQQSSQNRRLRTRNG